MNMRACCRNTKQRPSLVERWPVIQSDVKMKIPSATHREFLFVFCNIFLGTIMVQATPETECRTAETDQTAAESRLQQAPQGGDVTIRLWSPNLTNPANIKRLRAIRTGLLQNMNVTIHELYDAVEVGDMREVRFQLRQINEKWKDIQDLHRAIIQTMPEEDVNGLQEESKLFADNRDVLLRLNQQAEEFLAGTSKPSASSVAHNAPESKQSIAKTAPSSPKVNKAEDTPRPQSQLSAFSFTSSTTTPRPVTITNTRTTSASPTFRPATTLFRTTAAAVTTTTTVRPTTARPVSTTAAPQTQLDRYKNKREKLVEQLRSIIRTIEPAADSQNVKTREEVRNLLGLIDDKVWPEIIKLSAKIYAEEEPTSNKQWRESLYQQDLKNTLARIHFKVGLRKCISADETYYLGKCQRYGNVGVPCAENQQLVDGKDNTGFCHCKYQDPTQPYNGLVYIDGQCYVQNVQGPCLIGQWIVVNDEGDPICTTVPVGCGPPSKDGRKVYWIPEPKKPGSCVQLGSRQQCGTLFRRGFQLFCGNHPNATVEQSPANNLPPLAQQRCPKGYFVDQYNRCIKGIQL